MAYVLLIWFTASAYSKETFTINNLIDEAECEELAVAVKQAHPAGRYGVHICRPYKPAK